MGYSSWSKDAYTHISSNYVNKDADEIFASKANSDMLPKDITVRESRDSDAHPESLAVMIFLDVTGSMGRIPEDVIKDELGTLMNTIIDNGVEHPQILFGAIGDHISDTTPLQLGQFECSAEDLDKWLKGTYIEGNGGGQCMESYLLAWLIAGRHTSIDCFEKRNEKGFLFTIGDEASWDNVDARHLKDLLGYTEASDVTDIQLLEEAQRLYNVYHIHVNEGSYKDDPKVLGYWKKMLGERVVILDNYHAICATIATIIAVQHGADIKDIVKHFDSNIAGMVTTALATVTTGAIVSATDDGVLKL
jgi:hypothetical protein